MIASVVSDGGQEMLVSVDSGDASVTSFSSAPPHPHDPAPDSGDSFGSLQQREQNSATTQSVITIAVEGCCHGELDKIYGAIMRRKETVDILFICGDFQCFADEDDLDCVAMPAKKMNSFHEYVSGSKVAPVLTVFVGGNHEASNILHSLYYGGFVAPNIYFLGFAGVVNFKGLRIGGLSGIFKQRNYRLGHFEVPPYSESSVRTVYHLRELEVYRMAHLLSVHRGAVDSQKLDVFLSHDWPTGIWQFGDCERLMRTKPFLRDDIQSGKLGSPPLMQILHMLKPRRWFAAHLHVRFDALVEHAAAATVEKATTETESVQAKKETRFMALDKVLPGRDFIQFLKIPVPTLNEADDRAVLKFDVEWMAILRKTHNLLQTGSNTVTLPAVVLPATAQELTETEALLRGTYPDLVIPNIPPRSLPQKARGLFVPKFVNKNKKTSQITAMGNFQTDLLLSGLGLPHIWTVAGQGAAKVAEPMAKRKYDEVNSSSQGSNKGLDPLPNPSLLVSSSGQAAYGGWYPNLPSDSKSSSTSKGCDGSDPNAIDI